MEEKIESHHSDKLQACLAEKRELESVMRECKAECGELLSKVSCLEEVLDSMGLQFENMQMGFGVSKYPKPIEVDPSLPIHTSCPINACLAYGLWYALYNHTFGPCSHSYHPWCINQFVERKEGCIR
jgi:hypothetical protein